MKYSSCDTVLVSEGSLSNAFPPAAIPDSFPHVGKTHCIKQIMRGGRSFLSLFFHFITIDHELLSDNFILMRSECIIIDRTILEI